jgi:ATP-binding cassette subfamily B protein
MLIRPPAKNKTGLARMAQIAGTKKWWLISSMFLSVLATIAQFVPTITIYYVLVEISENATDVSQIDQSNMYMLGLISLVSVLVYGLFTYASMMLSHIAAFTILYEIRIKIAEKLTRLSMGFFNKKTSGQIKKVMDEDVEKIESVIAHHIPDLTSALVFPVLMIIVHFFFNWRLALVALIPFPIAILVQASMMRDTSTWEKYHDGNERMNSVVVEYVRGMPVVKVFDAAAESFNTLKEAVYGYRKFAYEMTDKYSLTYPTFLVFILPFAIFFLWQSDDLVGNIPRVFTVLLVGGGMFFLLTKLMFFSNLFKQISVGTKRIDAILDSEEISEDSKEVTPQSPSLEFKDVTFGYNDSPIDMAIGNIVCRSRRIKLLSTEGRSV